MDKSKCCGERVYYSDAYGKKELFCYKCGKPCEPAPGEVKIGDLK